MDSDSTPRGISAPIGKKRIPVKCDGKRPCTRCRRSRKQCVFFERPKDPTVERLENVEAEVQRLRGQLDDMHALLRRRHHQESRYVSNQREIAHMQLDPGVEAAARHGKQRRSGFDIREEPISDFISEGLMTFDQAMSCFKTFFQGCDRYIPVFDPELDTFTSVRARSSILLNAICTIGSRVETRSGSQIPDLLHAELKRWINVVIQNRSLNCLESVQALLIVACYSAERSLILSFATRMALDLGLDEAFEELIQRLTMKEIEGMPDMSTAVDDEERSLMRKSRTWFGLLVLDHIFHVDGGKPPGIRMTGNAHQCRILLRHRTSTVLDLRLFSQVELNVIRAKINDTLDAKETLNRPDIAEFVHEAKVDLDLWFDDWLRIIENALFAEQERPFLLAALRVQKCWAELILHCKALRSMGVENVAAMSPTECTILQIAKSSARKHLRLISLEPDFYLAKLKYAMDFVWAKCAFCFLLLLKLSRLLPERKEEHQELLDHGNRLLDELSRTVGEQPTTSTLTSTITTNSGSGSGSGTGTGNGGGGDMDMDQQPPTTPFWELFDAQADLQAFVPEQFVREWDFPGLNLFYFPTAWQDFFGDFPLTV
ncbi:C6 zinc finger domain protein [Aspergillus ellipticus CBS 707.79]|uniref:C6 zinc finger domain protein n=1 Tax=Aspergillus ellipticus CBS 707.79 TaxID=1448320 RepID=A0A319EEQ4_9EURO|nr:C6 zinc finger domain protein [Aspergillus ellipticus CBS 707.79]